MRHYAIADAARRDLLDLLTNIAIDSTSAAIRMNGRFLQTFDLLLHSPKMGRAFRTGLRRLNEGDYAILYRDTDDGIEIARIVHGMQDLDALFGE